MDEFGDFFLGSVVGVLGGVCSSHECVEEHDGEGVCVCGGCAAVFGVAVGAFADFGCREFGFSDGAGVGLVVVGDLGAVCVDDAYGGVVGYEDVGFVDVAYDVSCCVYCVDCYGEVACHEEAVED